MLIESSSSGSGGRKPRRKVNASPSALGKLWFKPADAPVPVVQEEVVATEITEATEKDKDEAIRG
jgi:hypothetical protein